MREIKRMSRKEVPWIPRTRGFVAFVAVLTLLWFLPSEFTFHDIQENIYGASIIGQGRFNTGGEPHYDFHLDVNGIKQGGVGILTKAW